MKFLGKSVVCGCVLLMVCAAFGDTIYRSTKTVNGVHWWYFPMGKIPYSLSHGRAILGWASFTETPISGGTQYSYTDGNAISTSTAGKVSIPEFGETDIRGHAFWNCTNMTSLVIPKDVAAIDRNVFNGCNRLQSFEVSDANAWFWASNGLLYKKITYDNPYLEGFAWLQLYLCPPGMTNATISASNGSTNVSEICESAFSGCTRLQSVSIPNSIKTIGANAFKGCTALTSITIPSRVDNMGLSVWEACSALKSVSIQSKTIEEKAFADCSSLSSLSFSNSCTNIGASAFLRCGKLASVRLPSAIATIGENAFYGCGSLKSVYFPISFNGTIGANAFAGGPSFWYYNVTGYGEMDPNPPMSKISTISITPTTRNFGTGGGGAAIITSGSGTWTAAVSDSWITLNSTSGSAGTYVAYTVSATTNVEQRVGYVYVAGYTHTITQDGVGGSIDSDGATFESGGGTGTITVSAANKMAWRAKPNVSWLYVSKPSGIGSGEVKYLVEPYNEVSTRQGTLTVAGNTFTVFQYGRRMKLDSYSSTQNYEVHTIPITVNALAITQWSVTPNNSWISVVDAGNGHGGDLVTIAIAENPSYKKRTGTVTIGTETYTVTQQGRPTEALSFNVSPDNSTASVEGANGLVSITATPDLPWVAASGANWITVYASSANGAGNGNVVYSASPNPTLSQRTGTITVTPEAASGMAAKTHTVTQPAATASISLNGYEFEAAGESCSVDVSCASIVQWSISESLDWITVNGSTSRTGPGTVTLQATANNTVYPRSGTVTIAGKTFSVSQKARGVEIVGDDNRVYGTDGGDGTISVHPDGNVAWMAVASHDWIIIFGESSGTGDGEIMYILAPYVSDGNGNSRTGWITVGDKKVYITQRAYDLSIDPNGTNVVGNAGTGEFGVSATIGDVWTAIVTEPWITIISGYDSGTGSGTVRFIYTENMTGKTRTGKIIVNGEVYTLEQRARQMVAISAMAEHGGHVSGGGSYDLGTEVTLTALPDSGYAFSYWSGATNSMQNPLTVTADVAKSYTAVFESLPIALTNVVSDTNGVLLAWNNLAWAGTYRIYRGITSVPSSATVLVELPNNGNCTYLDETGDVNVEYWYWIEAEGPSDEVMSEPMTGRKEKPIVISSITYENLRGATNPNPATYREGTLVSFQNPGTVTGYTFAGWTPAQITADMTGAQTVRAAWTANSYSIAYNPNGGSGTMDATAMVYDGVGAVASNGFTYAGHVFTGWATNATGEVVYGADQSVSNLTAQASGVVTLYAVWEELVVAAPSILCDGVAAVNGNALFTGESCTISLVCATEGASIYYGINAVPRQRASNLYSAPFAISDSCTIYAFAVKEGVKSGDAISVTITKKTLSLGDAANADATGSALAWTTGGDANWTPIADATSTTGYSAQSGAIGDAEEEGQTTTTWLQTRVSGAGTVSFRWKVDCEDDGSSGATWDRAEFSVDGTTIVAMDGDSGWQLFSHEIMLSGEHVLRWTFIKDDYNEEACADHAWVSGFTWSPVNGESVDQIPEVASDSEVASALAGTMDANLTANITNVSQYAAYRSWALSVTNATTTAQTIKESTRTWLSYAFATDALIDKELTSDDVKIESFAPASTDGKFEFTVSVKDVNIGGGSVAVETLKENLKKVLGIEGSATLLPGSFSSDNIDITFDTPVDGKARFTVTPQVDAGSSFFMRVKVK